jgi:hypothetical protein
VSASNDLPAAIRTAGTISEFQFPVVYAESIIAVMQLAGRQAALTMFRSTISMDLSPLCRIHPDPPEIRCLQSE